jgi:putative hydrolase of the HAD superfamily
VGDGGSDELKGARDLGMTTVMMTGVIKEMWPERIEPRLPFADFVIEKLDELVTA